MKLKDAIIAINSGSHALYVDIQNYALLIKLVPLSADLTNQYVWQLTPSGAWVWQKFTPVEIPIIRLSEVVEETEERLLSSNEVKFFKLMVSASMIVASLGKMPELVMKYFDKANEVLETENVSAEKAQIAIDKINRAIEKHKALGKMESMVQAIKNLPNYSELKSKTPISNEYGIVRLSDATEMGRKYNQELDKYLSEKGITK